MSSNSNWVLLSLMIGDTDRSTDDDDDDGTPDVNDDDDDDVAFGCFNDDDDDCNDVSSVVCFLLLLLVFLLVVILLTGRASSLGSFLASMPTMSLQITEHLISSSLHDSESGIS